MDTLKLLSMQTATNQEFDADTFNYEAELPNVRMAGDPRSQPTVNPHVISSQLSPFSIANLEEARFQQPALNNYTLDDKLYIAEACGNCARAYGSPLTCALIKTQIDPLMACSDFCSPFDIGLKNA